jgi:hypothetical protein
MDTHIWNESAADAQVHTAEERQKTGSNHKLNQPHSRIYMKVLEEMEKICELIEQCSSRLDMEATTIFQ